MQTEIIQDFVKMELSTKKSEKDKFKPYFCGKDFYITNQSQFQTIHNLTKHLRPKYKVILFTICLCCLRRKNDWFAGLIVPARHSDHTDHLNFSLYSLFKSIGIIWPKKMSPDISLSEFLSTVKIKPIPESAMSGLFHFLMDDYTLEILNYEPTPAEVLEFQIQNKRVLTFEDDYSLWINKKYGERDVLSFILHDLIHAEHFLSDPEKRLSQIGFYKFIQIILKNNLLDQLLLSAEFNKHFSYLISDMNSHLIHLLKTFRAILDQHSNEHKNNMIWTEIGQLVQPSTTDAHILRGALNHINTPLFSTSDAITLLNFFQNELN